MPIPRRSVSQIPSSIHVVCIVALDAAKEAMIHAQLSMAHGKKNPFLIWKPPQITKSAPWTREMESSVVRHLRNDRFDNVGALFVVGAPKDTNQARTLTRICPHAHVVYVGQDLAKPTTNVQHRSVIASVRDMVRRGHKMTEFDAGTIAEKIVANILVKPVHVDLVPFVHPPSPFVPTLVVKESDRASLTMPLSDR